MMPNFSELQNKAVLLPGILDDHCSGNLYAWMGFFCACLPVQAQNMKSKQDARLIKSTADILSLYPTTESTKQLILTGMYIYVSQRYQSVFDQLTNKAFLDILCEQMEIASLSEIEQTQGLECMDELQAFCLWVKNNQRHAVLRDLFHAFPADMQCQIYDQKLKYQSVMTPGR